jgi:hypothetical protein
MLCSSEAKLVENYFLSWQVHDNKLLVEIFSVEAVYEIICLKRSYVGLSEIVAYWTRNSLRQKEIFLEHEILGLKDDKAFVRFKVDFFDVEEKQKQLIEGRIIFYFKNRKIFYLKENYIKTIK